MRAWLAKVLVIKDSVEFVKWNEKKVLLYQIKDSVEFSKQNEWKVIYKPQDKKDMRAWLAKVLVINDSVKFVKWNEENVLP